jgi:hypothetical protein
MPAPFQKIVLAAAIGLLFAAPDAAEAAMYLKYEGIKLADPPTGGPEVWRWVVTPLGGSSGGVGVAVGDITGDGMDANSVALLLPAVQKVREAAAQWPGSIPQDLSRPLTDIEIGLLLPAVQKVREAASAMSNPGTASLLDFTTDLDPLSTALLLPAVQKVREAALQEQARPGVLPDAAFFSLLLPATHTAFETAGRVKLANHELPRMLSLPGAGDAGLRFETEWELQRGQVTLLMSSLPVSAVPEPATWALWLGALAGLGVLRRGRLQPGADAVPARCDATT